MALIPTAAIGISAVPIARTVQAVNHAHEHVAVVRSAPVTHVTVARDLPTVAIQVQRPAAGLHETRTTPAMRAAVAGTSPAPTRSQPMPQQTQRALQQARPATPQETKRVPQQAQPAAQQPTQSATQQQTQPAAQQQTQPATQQQTQPSATPAPAGAQYGSPPS